DEGGHEQLPVSEVVQGPLSAAVVTELEGVDLLADRRSFLLGTSKRSHGHQQQGEAQHHSHAQPLFQRDQAMDVRHPCYRDDETSYYSFLLTKSNGILQGTSRQKAPNEIP